MSETPMNNESLNDKPTVNVAAILFIAIASIAAGAAGGYWFSKHQQSSQGQTGDISAGKIKARDGKTVLYWYDPMVPEQKFDKPGKSPFMDMQLIPRYKEESNDHDDSGDGGVTIPAQAMQNLGIRLGKVEMAEFGDDLSAVGRIEADERRFSVVQSRVSGFVEKLNVRAIGDPVRKGQKLAEIYAPELLAAQQEYLALLEYEGATVTDGLAQSARSRLKLLGMPEGEITAIARKKAPNARFGIYAPASGIVTELGVREGGQLLPGSSLMQISDLSSVWLIAEVPERDAARARLDAPAELVLQSLSNEVFKGRVAYLYPALDAKSRSLQVRVELPNRDGKLRPGMYGNVSLNGKRYEALAVAGESIIATGKRKVVIVKEAHGFRPAEVATGQEKNGLVEITSGLSAGEEVVVSGQFLVDSEASLTGVLARLSQQTQSATKDTGAVMQAAAPAATTVSHGRGKVVEVNPDEGEITLSHEPIADLNWPAMTMGFKVNKTARANGPWASLKPGDQVEFDLTPDVDSSYRIEYIKKLGAKP